MRLSTFSALRRDLEQIWLQSYKQKINETVYLDVWEDPTESYRDSVMRLRTDTLDSKW